jgi:hypothetical protein
MLLASAGYASAAADTVIAAALTLAEGAPVTALTRLLH